MFNFTIENADFLNDFINLLSDYVNKSYKFSMKFLANPMLAQYKENERLVLIVINKSVFQNLYSFLRLNESNMQFSAFSCLETAVNSIRLYKVLSTNANYLHQFITSSQFSLEQCEKEVEDNKKEYNSNEEEFSILEFSNGLRKFTNFELKMSAISSQIIDNNVYLGLSCGKNASDSLQNEVRKNIIGAFLSLQIHNKMFFNGGIDQDMEELEDKIYSQFLAYIKLFSNN